MYPSGQSYLCLLKKTNRFILLSFPPVISSFTLFEPSSVPLPIISFIHLSTIYPWIYTLSIIHPSLHPASHLHSSCPSLHPPIHHSVQPSSNLPCISTSIHSSLHPSNQYIQPATGHIGPTAKPPKTSDRVNRWEKPA